MRTLPIRLQLSLAVFALLGASAPAQTPGAGPGMTGALPKLFGSIKSFTAKADVQILDPTDKEIASMPLDFAMLDSKIRVEMDLTKMKNREMPPGMADSLKQMGMARVISIMDPTAKQVHAIYPDCKSVLTMPLPSPEAASLDQKLAQTEVGKETVDGHPCIKNQCTIKDDQGKDVEAVTWNATDMQKFPLKIQTKDKENTSFIHFTDVKLAKPPAQEFSAPADYTKYTDAAALQQALMKKMMEGAQKK